MHASHLKIYNCFGRYKKKFASTSNFSILYDTLSLDIVLIRELSEVTLSVDHKYI